jgi:hypothetical protein
MRFPFLSIAVFLFYISCSNANDDHKTPVIPKPVQIRKLDPILNKIFKTDYANFRDNELVRGNALKQLNKAIDSILPLNYLTDFRFKVWRVGKNPHGKGALVQFYTDDLYTNDTASLSNFVRFDVFGLMDENLGATINEKGIYKVFGHKYKRLNEAEAFSLVNQVYYSPTPSIDKATFGDFHEFKLGDFICEVDSLRLVK